MGCLAKVYYSGVGESKSDQQGDQSLKTDVSRVDLTEDRTYTREDLNSANDELIHLRRKSARQDKILENIGRDIKLLKAQQHGEDSEERQIKNKEYESALMIKISL